MSKLSRHPITDLWNEGAGYEWERAPSAGKVVCDLPRLPLKSGHYTFNLMGRINGQVSDYITDAGVLDVEDGDFFGTGRLPGEHHGHFLFDQQWNIHERAA